MAIITVPEFRFPDFGWHALSGHTGFVLDASGEKLAGILRASKAGVITGLGFKLGPVTTGQTLRVSLQGVDAATGLPDGIISGFFNVTVLDTDDLVWKTGTFDVPRTVVVDQRVAIVIEFASAIGNLEIHGVTGIVARWGFQNSSYLAHFASAVWTKQGTALPCFDVIYSDNSRAHIWGNVPIKGVSNTSFGGTNQIGNSFKLPATMRTKGMWIFVDPTSSDNFAAVLYDFNSVEVRRTTIDPDTTEGGPCQLISYWDSPVTLGGGELPYRVALEAGGIFNFDVWALEFQSNDVMDGYAAGKGVFQTGRAGPSGSWIDSSTKRIMMGLIMDGIGDEPQDIVQGPVVSSSDIFALDVRAKV